MEFIDNIKAFIIKHNLIDFKTRNHKMSLVAMTLNFSVAVFKILAAFYISSYFLIVSSIYSVGIGLTKRIFFRGVMRAKENPYKEKKYVLLMYGMLFLSSIVYIIYMIRLFSINEEPFNYGRFISLIIVLVSLIEIISAIIGLVKSTNLKDTLLTALKTVMLASALISVVVAQSAFLTYISNFGTEFRISNPVLGLVMGSIAAIIALVMFVKSTKTKIKPLSEMTEEELWKLFPIHLVGYKKAWERRYKRQTRYIKTHINDGSILFMDHIGSTAIKGIQSKDIIDIMIVVSDEIDLVAFAKRLIKLDYKVMREDHKRIDLNKGYTRLGFARDVFHVHLRRKNDIDEIYFKDYLNEHHELAREYESLKIFLNAMHKNDRDAYMKAKNEFVDHITKTAKKQLSNPLL